MKMMIVPICSATEISDCAIVAAAANNEDQVFWIDPGKERPEA
jgi:hypothetical protein